jgi:hypothetical protein
MTLAGPLLDGDYTAPPPRLRTCHRMNPVVTSARASPAGRVQVNGSAGPIWSRRRQVEKFVGVCVIVSGGAHGLVTQQHFQEWWGYGVFFLATGICLVGFGLALVTDAIDPRYMPGDVHHLRRIMYASGAIGTVSILGLYLITRTAGIPLGPASGSIESVGVVDVVAKVAELLTIAGLVVLLVKTRPRGTNA